jgi:small ligand-binding sensory domain FIST
MPFAVAQSKLSDSSAALMTVCAEAVERLSGPPHLAILFYSPEHRLPLAKRTKQLRLTLAECPLIGVQGESIICNEEEIEQSPCLSLWLGRWEESVSIETFRLEVARTSEGTSVLGWPDGMQDVAGSEAGMILLADPYSFDIDGCLQEINRAHPGLQVAGGMASGAHGPGPHHLLWEETAAETGAVGVLIKGGSLMRTIVSQGCRPIGRTFIVTAADENVVMCLGGKPALDQLRAMWDDLGGMERSLAQQGLHLGRVINEYQSSFGRGDFLVRNVIGFDQDTGAMAVNDRIRVGQTVQFHVRDAQSAHEDLDNLLKAHVPAAGVPAGALLFTCNGRGTRLFQESSHDARLVSKHTQSCPLAGFFAQGEIGPVGGRNFIHGFTASIALFPEP